MRGFQNGFYNCFTGFGHGQYGGFIMMGIGLVLIAVIVYIALKKGSHLPSSSSSESPMETLQKRYINGEISKEEFVEKKEILNLK